MFLYEHISAFAPFMINIKLKMEPILSDIDLAMNSIKEQLLIDLFNSLGSNKEENSKSFEYGELNS